MGGDVTKTDKINVITKGAKFKFIRSNMDNNRGRGRSNMNRENMSKPKSEVLVARGPLLGSIVVMASSSEIGSKYKALIKFTVSRVNDPLSSMSQNEWVIKGWSRCSKECGGGKQHLIVRYV